MAYEQPCQHSQGWAAVAAPTHHREGNPKDSAALEAQMPRLIPWLVAAKGKVWLSPSPPTARSHHHLLSLMLAIAGLGIQPRGGSVRDCDCWSGSTYLLHHGISTIRPYPQFTVQLHSIPRKGSIHYSKPQARSSLPPHCP